MKNNETVKHYKYIASFSLSDLVGIPPNQKLNIIQFLARQTCIGTAITTNSKAIPSIVGDILSQSLYTYKSKKRRIMY